MSSITNINDNSLKIFDSAESSSVDSDECVFSESLFNITLVEGGKLKNVIKDANAEIQRIKTISSSSPQHISSKELLILTDELMIPILHEKLNVLQSVRGEMQKQTVDDNDNDDNNNTSKSTKASRFTSSLFSKKPKEIDLIDFKTLVKKVTCIESDCQTQLTMVSESTEAKLSKILEYRNIASELEASVNKIIEKIKTQLSKNKQKNEIICIEFLTEAIDYIIAIHVVNLYFYDAEKAEETIELSKINSNEQKRDKVIAEIKQTIEQKISDFKKELLESTRNYYEKRTLQEVNSVIDDCQSKIKKKKESIKKKRERVIEKKEDYENDQAYISAYKWLKNCAKPGEIYLLSLSISSLQEENGELEYLLKRLKEAQTLQTLSDEERLAAGHVYAKISRKVKVIKKRIVDLKANILRYSKEKEAKEEDLQEFYSEREQIYITGGEKEVLEWIKSGKFSYSMSTSTSSTKK